MYFLQAEVHHNILTLISHNILTTERWCGNNVDYYFRLGCFKWCGIWGRKWTFSPKCCLVRKHKNGDPISMDQCIITADLFVHPSFAVVNTLQKMVQEWMSQFQSIICWRCWTNKIRSMEAPCYNLLDLKDLLLRSWCEIPQHTLGGLSGTLYRGHKVVFPQMLNWV